MKKIDITNSAVIERIRASMPIATTDKNGLMGSGDRGLRKAGSTSTTHVVTRLRKGTHAYFSALYVISMYGYVPALMYLSVANNGNSGHVAFRAEKLAFSDSALFSSDFGVHTYDDGEYIYLYVSRGGVYHYAIVLDALSSELLMQKTSLPEGAVEMEVL